MTTVIYFFGYAKIGSTHPDQKPNEKVRVDWETLNTHIIIFGLIRL